MRVNILGMGRGLSALILGIHFYAWNAVLAQVETQHVLSTEAQPGRRFGPFHSQETRPLTLLELGRRLDCVSESIRDDGLVVIKQPDVFSQARMTKYRREFEDQMSKELGRFKVVLAGRIARVDAAAIDSQSSLAAALGPPKAGVTVTAPTAETPPVVPALNGTFTAPRFVTPPTLGQDTLNLGLEPVVMLDEEKRYLDHLHEIRRVSAGSDIADSAGYGLYLVRMPVSITPGEKTVMGHGAELTATVKHEFPAGFLSSTFRNLVINDLVEQLGPAVYEAARVGVEERRARAALEGEYDRSSATFTARLRAIVQENGPRLMKMFPKAAADSDKPILTPSAQVALDALTQYVLRLNLPGVGATPAPVAEGAVFERASLVLSNVVGVYQRRLAAYQGAVPLIGARVKVAQARLDLASKDEFNLKECLRTGAALDREALSGRIVEYLFAILLDAVNGPGGPNGAKVVAVFEGLLASALPDDVGAFNATFGVEAFGARRGELEQATIPLAEARLRLATLRAQLFVLKDAIKTLVTPSNRAPKRNYPIAPRELIDFFLAPNLQALVDDAVDARVTESMRATDVRNYLRQQLSVAFDLMSRPSARVDPPVAPLDNLTLMNDVLAAVHNRRFEPGTGPTLGELASTLLATLPEDLYNVRAGGRIGPKPLAALCWAIAVDAALLDESLRVQAELTFKTNGMPCPDWSSIRFFTIHPDLNEPASAVFNDYVAKRWPIITFALDPVSDEQNILDSFSLRHDLQLALAFAFTTGQISFNQLTTFRRKIERDSETVALNRTVSAFAHGNETFGWRITPRFQNPPSQGNLATVASTLLQGGPGPNYGLRKSKIEPGQRELAAVLVVPSFLPTFRVDASGNWFKLHDPEHLEVRTARMLEQGSRVQDLRGQLASACDSGQYRATDVCYLRTKIDQLDAMLPIQSRVVSLPFDNASTGFDLFTEGATALVPELSGFEGADEIIGGQESDLLIYGKFFSIHETAVVVGGRNIPGESAGYEILSREVIRVHVPPDVQWTRTYDGRYYVEVYVATPNGISNRLLIPFQGPQGAAQSASGGDKPDPAGTVLTTVNVTQKQFPPKADTGANAATPQAKAASPEAASDIQLGTERPKSYDAARAGEKAAEAAKPSAAHGRARPRGDGPARAEVVPVSLDQPASGDSGGPRAGSAAEVLGRVLGVAPEARKAMLAPAPAPVPPISLATPAASPVVVTNPAPVVVVSPGGDPSRPKVKSRFHPSRLFGRRAEGSGRVAR